jgi:hypothetical protein
MYGNVIIHLPAVSQIKASLHHVVELRHEDIHVVREFLDMFPDDLPGMPLLAVLKPNRIILKHTDANCSSFHIRVFLGLSNPQGQRQTSTLSIPHDNFGERKAKFNLGMSRITQM